MENTAEPIVGIDLGTTNSEVAAFIDGKPQIIGNGNRQMLPSCVGLSPSGELLIGESARNQMLLYPDRTIRSVKRLMGSDQPVKLGDKTFTPPEISALILRELASWAEQRLGQPVKKAVITVPAYFSDAQRNATREAGALAGLEVVRMINEPTAASLAYGLDTEGKRTVMIYDLGGGTLDVSIVRIDGEITEVLSSHGNNHLGGDDFDQKLVDHLLEQFRQRHSIELRQENPGAYARLWFAAEAAKQQLSFEPYAAIREESLIVHEGKPLNLELEISRAAYESMIRPLVEQTLDSVSRALNDAGLTASALDEILLVGGSTRTPLVVEMLQTMCSKTPRQDLHPDLCVALGAGVLASRAAGHDVQRVLVDVSPFSFGIGYLGERDGYAYPHCYRALIKRNTPLPITRTEEYYTAADFQTGADIDVYQGDDPDALRNVPVGNFKVEGLRPVAGQNPLLMRMRLDLDGILHVTAIEKRTGLSKHVAISGATRRRNDEEIHRGRLELDRLFANRQRETGASGESDSEEEPLSEQLEPASADSDASPSNSDAALATDPGAAQAVAAPASAGVQSLLERSRRILSTLQDEDREEAINLIDDLVNAEQEHDASAIDEASKALGEFLFFVEGR